MDRDQAIEYINRRDWHESRLGLERIQELLERLGNPHLDLRYVHVAGTNGKGSACAMLAATLKAAGLRTGLYTSPFINKFNERIQIDGQSISDSALAETTARIRVVADQMNDHPTEFELVTAVALQYYRDQGCDIVVLEVGLGGKLDATNVIPASEVAIITPISLDHTTELGDTVEKIAAEKGGIIKPGSTVVSSPQSAGVAQVLSEICESRGTSITFADITEIKIQQDDLTGQVFSYRQTRDLRIALLGSYQTENAAVVIEAVELLRSKGWRINDEALREGLSEARWPARFELVNRNPWVIVDGGHNPQGADSLALNLRYYFPGKRVHFIIGVMADKDVRAMLAAVLPLAEQVFTVSPDNPRALSPVKLAEYVRAYGLTKVKAYYSVNQAVSAAMCEAGHDDVICAFGSFYMAGAIRQFFGLSR